MSTPHPAMFPTPRSTPSPLKAKLDRGDKFQFIDVREPHEYQIARIPGAKLIPLNDVPKRLGELDPDAEVIVHCKSGVRSGKVADFLRLRVQAREEHGRRHPRVERQGRSERSQILSACQASSSMV